MIFRPFTVLLRFVVAILFCSPILHAAEAQHDELVQLIVKLIGNPDKEFRAAGLEKVRTAARGAESTKVFAAQLPRLDAQGQVALLHALADRRDQAARSAVLELLKSSQDETVRTAAIGAMGKLGDAAQLPLLIQTLNATGTQRAAARQSLVEISGKTVNHQLADALHAASPEVKTTLIEVLGARRAADVFPAIVAATVDNDGQVRRAAMSVLGQIGRPEMLAQLLPGVLKAKDGDERDHAERNVANICNRIGDESQRGKALIEALKSVDAAQRDELLSLAGRVGGPTLIDFVAGIATGEDKGRRRLGIDALGKWPDASVADKLLEITNSATDPAERRLAFQSYLKVAAARDGRPDRERLERMKQALANAKSPDEVALVIYRTRNAYDIDALRLVLPYVGQPRQAEVACETIVEIAHHREVRDPNKAEVDKMLDKVIATSKDPVVIDRAHRYKKGQTWTRPARK